MGLVFFISIIIIVIVIVASLARRPRMQDGVSGEKWPFYARRLLSQPEQVLYFRLINSLPDYIIFAQVQLSRFLGVKSGNNFQSWNNRINRMSADFLICNKDASIVAAVELDDSSHKKTDRQKADAKKDKALQSAGIPVIRWQASSLPDEAAIRAAIEHNQTFRRIADKCGSR
jgi:very-short-patch-repair endonuclease